MLIGYLKSSLPCHAFFGVMGKGQGWGKFKQQKHSDAVDYVQRASCPLIYLSYKL